MRIAAIVEYDGAGFCGWQIQDGERTVQACVEEAVSRVADEPVRIHVAGRTDTGVHACAQVIHFDTHAERADHEWLRGTNSCLPSDVALLWVGRVEPAFHARFSATSRCYRYVIVNRPVRPTFLARRVAWDYRRLEINLMRPAARSLIGTHDFSSFRAAQCQAKDPVRELRRLDVSRRGDLVCIETEANAFLHHMVRNIAGVLMSIGAGEQPPEWAEQVLAARDRTAADVTAPPEGLYLLAVEYPTRYGIPRLPPPALLW